MRLQGEYVAWRRAMGMEPTKGEIFDLKVWAMLVIWNEFGIVAPFEVDE